MSRSEFDLKEWIARELCIERSNLDRLPPEAKRSVGHGMTLGAKETLERLERFLDGDDEA